MIWLKRLFCSHDWRIVHIVEHTNYSKALLICTKCYKLKVKKDCDENRNKRSR